MDATMEARLQEMIDRHEIWQVLQRYARGLDRMDVPLVRSCYWEDAIEDHGQYVGDVGGFIEYANHTSLMFQSTQHGLMNHSCDLQGDDAYCETYYLFTSRAAQSPHLFSTGRYVDHFQRRDGEWRIANRVTIVEGTYDVVDCAQTANMPPAYGPGEVSPATRDRDDVSYHRPLRPRQPHKS